MAFAPAGRLYACGLRAEELRDGVTIEERMRRYAHDDHRDRPRLIGMRFSDVIPEKPYPDEDWFFGSPPVGRRCGGRVETGAGGADRPLAARRKPVRGLGGSAAHHRLAVRALIGESLAGADAAEP